MQTDYSEFSFIERIVERWQGVVPSNIEGIGDDCAVINEPCGVCKVVSTDMLVEGVHFSADFEPWELGRRAVQVNLSDVAAMGARPVAILLSIAVPSDYPTDSLERLMEGVHSCGVALVGGDTTRSQGGLVVSVTVWGEAVAGNIKRRSGAQVGDVVVVSGELGASVVSGYRKPVMARTELGEWLGGRTEVGAMMDISDGVAGDIRHILKQSGVGAKVYIDTVPLAEGATVEQALCGGEDYELLFTVRPDEFSKLQSESPTTLYNIGEITNTENQLIFVNHNGTQNSKYNGYTHF